jgi:hypothetical protein
MILDDSIKKNMIQDDYDKIILKNKLNVSKYKFF